MPLTLGGLGLGNTQRTRDAAHWESWADSLEMIRARHPEVASRVVKGVATRSVKYKFIKTTFIKFFSSKTTFIKDHFHQRPLSLKNIFIRNHFHQKK